MAEEMPRCPMMPKSPANGEQKPALDMTYGSILQVKSSLPHVEWNVLGFRYY